MSQNKKTHKGFETAQVKLHIRNQHLHTVTVNKVTPPEFLMLQHVHGGHEAVELLEKQGPLIHQRQNEFGQWMKKTVSQRDMLERLTLKYGESAVDAVFPGSKTTPMFPLDFESIQVEQTEEIPVEEDSWEVMDETELSQEQLGEDSAGSDLVGEKQPSKSTGSKGKNTGKQQAAE